MFDPVFIKVLIGTLLLAASSSVVGVFSFLKGESLVGDAIAHALLPGVVLAFIIGDGRNPVFLILGALVAGLTAHYGISFLEQRTKLKGDTAISLVLSTFFGFGIMLLSAVQRTGQGQQAGLERFLLGKAAAITLSDLYVFGALALLLLASVALFFKGFQLMTFNEDFAAAKVDQEAATELFVYAFGNSLPTDSEKAQAAVVAHRAAISKWFYDCSVEMQKNLALMYVQDPRFKKYYDGRVNGLAQYVHDAIMAQ